MIAKKVSLSQQKRAVVEEPCGELCVDAKGATEKPEPQELSQHAFKAALVVSDPEAKHELVASPLVKAAEQEVPAAEQCLCDIQGDKCTCSAACDKRQETSICAALLGPCTCEERAGSMCECSGHCAAMGDLMHACQSAPSCLWDGYFCAAEKAGKQNPIDASLKKVQDEEITDSDAAAESRAEKAFKLPRYVQALCAVVVAALAAFILLHL